jgi:hypothetical protein
MTWFSKMLKLTSWRIVRTQQLSASDEILLAIFAAVLSFTAKLFNLGDNRQQTQTHCSLQLGCTWRHGMHGRDTIYA